MKVMRCNESSQLVGHMIRLLAAAAILLAITQPASACGSLPADEHQSAVARDLRYQSELARKLASEADTVIVAEVLSEPAGRAEIQVLKLIKGSTGPRLTTIPSLNLVAIGCWPSAQFRNISLRSGEQYLFYLSSGMVLRAGSVSRQPEDIPLDQEVRLVQESPLT